MKIALLLFFMFTAVVWPNTVKEGVNPNDILNRTSENNAEQIDQTHGKDAVSREASSSSGEEL